MYIIIVGCGKVGSRLANALSDDNHDVVVIDSDSDNFNHLGSGFNGVTISGVPLDEDILKSAGIEKTDALVAVTQDDNMNITVSQIAKEIYNVPRVITRVYDPDRELITQQLGLTVMCPVTLFVAQVKNVLNQKKDGMCNSFGGRTVNFRFVSPPQEYIGKYIKNINAGNGSTIFGLIKNEEFQFSNPSLKIDFKDTLVIAEYA